MFRLYAIRNGITKDFWCKHMKHYLKFFRNEINTSGKKFSRIIKGPYPQINKTMAVERTPGIAERLKGWYSWLTIHVPSSIRKGVYDTFNTMRKKVGKLYNSKQEENFSDEDEKWYDVNPEAKLKPVLTKHVIKKKVKKYVINPKGAYDPAYFLNTTK